MQNMDTHRHRPLKAAGLWLPLTWRKVDAAEAWRQTAMKSAQWRKFTFKIKVLNDIKSAVCSVEGARLHLVR